MSTLPDRTTSCVIFLRTLSTNKITVGSTFLLSSPIAADHHQVPPTRAAEETTVVLRVVPRPELSQLTTLGLVALLIEAKKEEWFKILRTSSRVCN